MGLPDTYILPDNSNNAYHLTGDGVAVPVVRFLARHLLEPILEANAELRRKSRALLLMERLETVLTQSLASHAGMHGKRDEKT